MDVVEIHEDCTGCVFARPHICDDGEDLVMKCQRFPPVLMFDGEGVVQTLPDATDWCGEYLSDPQGLHPM